MYKIHYETEAEFQQALIDLPNDPAYSEVGVNHAMREHAAANDPFLDGNTALHRDYDDLWNLEVISAERAWDLSTGQGIVIAVIDSGLDAKHPDAPRLFVNPKEIPDNGIDDDQNGFIDDVSGWDFIGNDPAPQDDSGHGTHVAGIIAARANNGVGIAGIAYGAKVLPLKVLDKNGDGSEDLVAKAIVYAATMGAKVINLSLGGKGESSILLRAVREAMDLGAVVVDSSGNDHSDVADIFPAKYPETVTVGSIKSDGKSWSEFSNYGDALDFVAGGGGAEKNALSDPSGVNILSLLSSQIVSEPNSSYLVTSAASKGKYLVKSGTSMAAPSVAAVAALVLSVKPDLSPKQVRLILEKSAVDLGEKGKDAKFGYGRVDAYNAVYYALHEEIPEDEGASSGCAAQMSENTSILGFLLILVLTLFVLLRQERPDRKKSKYRDPTESTFV